MMDFPKPQHITATVESKDKLTEQVYLVKFILKEPKEISFVAGQCFMIHVAEGINRSMSIASPPSESHSILMCHDVSPMGPGSKWTMGLKVGDSVLLVGPLGRFVLDTESKRRKVMLATGTGVVPFRSMLLDYLGRGGTDEIVLYWGLRFESDIYWKEQFESLEKKYPNFHFILTLSKPSDTWVGHRGRVTEHIFEHEKNLQESDFYLCGNREMINEMKEKLITKGVPVSQIKSELFF